MSARGRRGVLLAIALAACGGGEGGGAAVDGGPGATADAAAGAIEQVLAVAPPILTPLDAGACVYPDGVRGAPGSYRLIDTCVICQCTTYGMRCALRAGCPTPACVLVDGTVLAPGQQATIACHDCACDAAGATSCARSTAGDCPADGCDALHQDGAIGFGESRAFSECHFCACDEVAGLSCTNLCHPECVDDVGVVAIDQERVAGADGCSTCVCDYGDLACEASGCE